MRPRGPRRARRSRPRAQRRAPGERWCSAWSVPPENADGTGRAPSMTLQRADWLHPTEWRFSVVRYRRGMELVYPPVIALARTMFRALDLKIQVEGAEHIPATGGAVLASNHVSYLDFIFCGF